MIARLVLLAAIVGSSISFAKAKTETPTLAVAEEIDRAVAEGLAALKVVQGLGVAVYTQDGAFARGFGVANIETGEKAMADTAFYIASSTKSFTALAMNALHHRGKINLDATLAEVAPGAFPDSVRPDLVTLRHLLSHSSGVRNDAIGFRLAFTGQHDSDLLWKLLQSSAPNEEVPLSQFDYTNTGYNIVTILTDKRLKKRWQDVLATEIFRKAGLTRTSAYMSEASRKGWLLARPHSTVGPGAPRRMPLEKTDATMQSAGGVIMSARDAARFLELMVEDGVVGGKRVLPAGVAAETRQPLVEVGEKFGDYARDAYGLGWYVGKYREDVLIHHFGGFAGARSHISYMPARKAGVAIFVNDSGAGFRLADLLANYIYDRLAGRDDAETAYKEALAALVARMAGIEGRARANAAEREARGWTLTRPRADYAGTYENELFGVFEIAADGETFDVSIGNLHSRAEPYTGPDQIRVELVPGNGEPIAFRLGEDGAVAGFDYDGNFYERR